MPTSDKELFIYETETKPNRYAVLVLFFTLGIQSISWIANELDIFRVGDREMRIGSIISIIAILIPILMFLLGKKTRSNSKLKYLVIIATIIFTFTDGLLLTFHTTIMLLFPILVAMLYKSSGLGTLAALGSVVAAVVSPVLGYLLGTWDIPFLKELLMIGTNRGLVTVSGGGGQPVMVCVKEILMYMVLPRLLMIGSCTLLLKHVIRLGENHVALQIEINRLSQFDNLTGLYNQNTYKKTVRNYKEHPTQIGMLFFDVNGLKNINDSEGHEAGDLLLNRCAQSLLNICDGEKNVGFRLGGDEFVLLMDGADEALCKQKIQEWEASMLKINEENVTEYDGLKCSMAVGMAFGRSDRLEEIEKIADGEMYCRKAKMKNLA